MYSLPDVKYGVSGSDSMQVKKCCKKYKSKLTFFKNNSYSAAHDSMEAPASCSCTLLKFKNVGLI